MGKDLWIRTINSKQKGKKGELELVHKLKDYGYNCRRTNQFCGNTGQADDVIGLDYIHIEVKRVEKLNVDEAIEQAKRDAKDNKFPTVFHRKNRKDWLVTMKLEDWIKLYNEYYSSMKLAERETAYENKETNEFRESSNENITKRWMGKRRWLLFDIRSN